MQKIIARLQDWFDCVVLLGPAPQTAAYLGFARAVGGALPLLQIDPAGARAAELKAQLRGQALKRPLLLIAGVDDALLLDWAQPFKVYLASGAGRDNPVAAQLCDLVMASSPQALEAVGLDRDWPGGRLAVPADHAAEAAGAAICAELRHGQAETKRLNIAVLYCDNFTFIETIYEHLDSFALHSRHNYFYFPASNIPELKALDSYDEAWPPAWDLDIYDAVIWHYLITAYRDDRLAAPVARRLAAYDGLKILFVQDEYETTAATTRAMQRAGIDVMMTCVPPEGLDYVYPAEKHPGVEFFRTLTGYVPEDRGLARFAIPMAQRSLRLAYRGRALAYRYGKLAREKYDIGVRMKALAAEHGVSADIAVDEHSRIYGTDWYRFLGSARATLATESGSNVFDFEGALIQASQQAEDSGQSFEDFHAQHLTELDGIVRMNQVSPKIFEAIRMRTALVCFEGHYSGVIQADVHYIPLKKDYSNVEEVFAKLEDIPYLEAMTTRAFDDVIGSGRYSYAAFVREMEQIIDSRVVRPARCEIVASPILRRRRGEAEFEPIVRKTPFEHIVNSGILRQPLRRNDLEEVMALVREAETPLLRHHAQRPPADARVVRRYGPESVVCYEYWSDAGASVTPVEGGARVTTPQAAWHYAAGVHLDFAGVDFTHELCWVRLLLKDADGEFRAGLYDGNNDVLDQEKVASGPGVHTLVLKAVHAQGNLLLFRTGQFERPAAATFLEAEILSAPRYSRAVLDAVRALRATLPGQFDWLA